MKNWLRGFDGFLYWDYRDEQVTLFGNTALVRSQNKFVVVKDGKEIMGMSTLSPTNHDTTSFVSASNPTHAQTSPQPSSFFSIEVFFSFEPMKLQISSACIQVPDESYEILHEQACNINGLPFISQEALLSTSGMY